MSPTSRNTLMIGGALILVALFLVCGPLSDRLGSGGKSVEEAPTVATDPPIDDLEPAAVADAVDAGALVAVPITETDVTADDDPTLIAGMPIEDADDDALKGAGIAAAGAAGAATGAGLASDSGAGASTTALPEVSAGVPLVVPPVNVAGSEPSGVDPAAAAAAAFDDSLAAAKVSGDGSGVAGPAVGRFPFPVAAPGGSSQALAAAAQPFGIGSGNVLLPCDSPGSGCRNLNAGSGPSRPFSPVDSGSGR